MLDAKAERIARERIRIEFDRREETLGHDLARTTSTFAKHGTFQSSMCAHAVANRYRDELAIREAVASTILREVCSTLNLLPSDQLEHDMQAFLQEIVRQQAGALHDKLLRTPPIGTSGAPGTGSIMGVGVSKDYERTAANALSNAAVGVEMFVAQMAKDHAAARASGQSVTVSGIANVVQMGSFTGSPVRINFNQELKEQLQRLLLQVEERLEDAREIAGDEAREVREIISDAKAEMAKEQPNRFRLVTLLSGAATAIQTVGALRGVYEGLKGALSLLGVGMP